MTSARCRQCRGYLVGVIASGLKIAVNLEVTLLICKSELGISVGSHVRIGRGIRRSIAGDASDSNLLDGVARPETSHMNEHPLGPE
jgi:hypothetical protein